jgi:phosphoglycolate phosphatase
MRNSGVVVWDVDGTLIPADLRWLRRAISRTYELPETDVTFPDKKVHGYTDESIVVDTAIASGISADAAEAGVSRFHDELLFVMTAGLDELKREQAAFSGVKDTIDSLYRDGFVQTVLTGNLRFAAEIKLRATGISDNLDLRIGGFGSDARDRFQLPEIVADRFRNQYGDDLDPKRTVIIGDAPNDIACARHAGFYVVVVAHRVGREVLAEHEPDAILDRLEPSEVLSTIRSLLG